MWGWEPQRPQGWTPNSLCIGIPNDPSDGSRTRRELGSPITQQMDPDPVVYWDLQWSHQWIPNPWCVGVPYDPTDESHTHGALGSPMSKWMDPKPVVQWDPL